MNQKLYKKIILAMMITAVGSTAAFASNNGTVSSSTLPFVGKVDSTATASSTGHKTVAAKTSKVGSDVPAEVREALAQKIMKATQKNQADNLEKAKKGKEFVMPVATVPTQQTVELTLAKTVQMALDYNRDIKVAHHGLREADWGIAEAKAGLMPSLDYSFAAGRAKSISTSSVLGKIINIGNSFSNTMSLSLPLYTGGSVEGAINVAKLSKETSQEELLRVEQSTKLSAVEGYFNLLAYQEFKDVYDESVRNLQGHVDNVTAQYNVGTVAKLDVLTSDVSLANAKTNAVSATNNVSIAEANLNNILGLPLQTKLSVADHRMPFEKYNISLEEAIDYAMQYRPEVLQSTLAVEKAKENVGIAEAGHRPTVAVGASNIWNDSDFPGSGNSHWTLSGGLTYSFYDGGATNAKIHIAREALMAAEETEAKTREAVSLEVKQAYLNIRSAAQRVESTKTAVDQAEESFKIARVRYTAGVGINLDVLDAQLNLNTAKTNHIQALYDYNVGIATLEQVMGMDVREGVLRMPRNN